MKRKTAFLSVIILGLLCFIYALYTDYPKDNEFLIYNAEILTMEKESPSAEAVYVKDGFIQAVGTKEDILASLQNAVPLIDLEGKTLLPGFIDIHSHPLLSALLLQMVDLSGFTHKTPKEVWAALGQYVQQAEAGEWIICKGLDPILTKGLVSPHISFLDSITPNNPVLIISQSLHSFWANSIAFEAVGISSATPNPSESSYYEKDKNGNLTGFFAEQEALKPFRDRITENYGIEKLMASAVQVLKNHAKKGMTSVTAVGLTATEKNQLLLYQHLCSEKAKPLFKIFQWLGKLPERSPLPRFYAYIRHDAAHLLPPSPVNGDDFYKIIGIKHWYDGSPYTGSMYIKEPYLESDLTQEGFRIPKGHHGEALLTKNELKEFILRYQTQGWQIAIHSQGDQAIEEILDVFEEVNSSNPIADYRHRLEHCLLLPNQSIQKMASLNITPSFHINHLYYYGKALKEDIIGAERAEKILPVKSVLDKNIPISLHADQPMYESDPLSLLATAVNRQSTERDSLNYSQAISVLDALKALTIDAAWQLHLEDKIGSIKKGKYADFVVLDKNPLNTDPKKLRNIQVLKTIRAGLTLYEVVQ